MVAEENLEGELADLLMERLDRMGNGGDEDEAIPFLGSVLQGKLSPLGAE